MARKRPCLLLKVVLSILLHVVASWGASDSDVLIKFKDSLENNIALATWNYKTPPCSAGDKANWVGVLCVQGKVWGLKLENMGLKGHINVDLLKQLTNLRTVSFMSNNLDGPFPEIKKLGALKSVYLSENRFSGEIPGDAFSKMTSLKKVHLAKNQFTGPIPVSLVELPKLMELRLEDNQFSGQIPNFDYKTLKVLNVSNNALQGTVPESLQKMNSNSFSGADHRLCGKNSCETAENAEEKSKNKLSTAAIAGIVIGSTVGLLAMVALIFFFHRHIQLISESIEDPRPAKSASTSSTSQVISSVQKSQEISTISNGSGSSHGSEKKAGQNLIKLSFVRDDREKFNLQDLLKASAEILGSGCFGSSYKAALTSGTVIVVKRFKHMNNVGKQEFQEHMRRIGRLRHPNLLPLVAYYYKKEEKLLVSDYVERGSLAVHLHGHQTLGQPSLDWPTRLTIVKGVANGLQYLYSELPSLIVPNGHLKSSNVLLSNSFEPLLTDYGLIPVTNQEHAHEIMVAYKSPEHLQHGRVTKKTDIWAFGALILEILTGKFPTNFVQQGKGTGEDLATWVNTVPEEDWLSTIIDNEIATTKNNEGEILKLLKIGLACCEEAVEERMGAKEAFEKIAELKDKKCIDGEDF